MGTILLLAALGFIALIWFIAEPISGIMGSTLIAKIIAIIIAFKIVTACLEWMMGPTSYVVR